MVTPQSMPFTTNATDPPACSNPNTQHPETMTFSSFRTSYCEIHLNAPAWMRGPPETGMVCLCYGPTSVSYMHLMHACRICAVCLCGCLFGLHYKMHLLMLFVCSLHSVAILQMIELLSMSASACYLGMFMICCANGMNASTWRLLLFLYLDLLMRAPQINQNF